MSDFVSKKTNGFTMKLWRGERMCLVAFDVDAPEPDLVGFAIECKAPGDADFVPLDNRISFSYDAPGAAVVDGKKKFSSLTSPFQKFRWVHFPFVPSQGKYKYRGTKIHMPSDNVVKKGTSIELEISLDPTTYAGFLDVGFTRGFASSQAFVDKFPKGTDFNVMGPKIIPGDSADPLKFKKLPVTQPLPGDIYSWMGFEAYELLFGFLDEAVKDTKISLDVFAYDLNEGDIVSRLEKLGGRLRIIIDDSVTKDKTGALKGHGVPSSPESKSAARLRKSAGKANVKRTHFENLQHHKVLIASRNGKRFKVLVGSTNFSYRGIYIQSNNALVFDDPDVAELYGKVFDAASADPAGFKKNDLAGKWHLIQKAGHPSVSFCFSPHTSDLLSLNPVRGAIDGAASCVLYAVAFLYQTKTGATREALDRLMKRPLFSYGISDKSAGLEVRKPDGSIALVDFAYLQKNAPEPFSSEWSGGSGINLHHKFVVTDFHLPTAKVFTGSSNLAPSGEKGNGDHLIMIEDQRLAIAYTIEALRVFDHLHFRSRMKAAGKTTPTSKAKKPGALTLHKPRAITGKPAWFEEYYVADTQRERDRQLFVK
jgi:phosphatidylserine/phosphatidylglycerophosphate/cardiolipin synthase-like enzyme